MTETVSPHGVRLEGDGCEVWQDTGANMETQLWGFKLLRSYWLGMSLVFVLPIGCSRYDYVRDADEQAYRLVGEKSCDPRWDQPDFSVDLDPRSRYFDPYDHISPPMPPDDPASNKYMHEVDDKKAWKYWGQYGHRPGLENPGWECDLPEYVEVNEEGEVRLDLETSVRLAYIHKPDFQQQLETVYLSALDVSTERFRFDTQFFGSFFSQYENRGPERPNVIFNPNSRLGPPNATSQWDFESSLTARRRLATAGELLVGFANNTVIELVGRNAGISTSVLNFSLIQPLLRAGGRAFAMEQLTIVERALLANLRAYERFRHGFFTDIAVGNEGVQGPRRRGGFFGGTGLTGFTGQGQGGFGGVGAATGFGGGFGGGTGGTGGGAGTTGFAGGGAGNVGGFLGLLQRTQQIRNSEQSLGLQLNTLEFLELSFEGNLIDRTQVDQFRQSIETERATLLQSQIGFQDALENYLIGTLGLPPDLPVELNEEFIEPFRFIGDEVLEVQEELTTSLSEFGDNETPTKEVLSEFLNRTDELFTKTDALLEMIDKDLEEHDEKIQPRLERMSATEKKEYQRDREKMDDDLKGATETLEKSAKTLAQLKSDLDTAKADAVAIAYVSLLKQMQNAVGELSQIQARARLAIIDVEQVHLKPKRALEIARAHRLDWMNNRAALVDTWRLIQFNANALKSDVTLRLDGDVSTLGGDNPLKFRGDTGTVRASLQFDPPFTRLTERNNFRQQLIEYQQARRQLIQYEDRVYFSLRQLLRNLDQLKVNLEIQRRAVSLAIQRVEQTRLRLNEPVAPAPPGVIPGGPGGGGGFGPTAALNLLTALSDLRNTQNNFLSVYLNYYASRMVLMRELGIMQIDQEGMWIDEPIELTLATLREYECDLLPPDVPSEWLSPEYFDGEHSKEPEAPAPAAPTPTPVPMEDEKPRAYDVKLPASRPRRSKLSS